MLYCRKLFGDISNVQKKSFNQKKKKKKKKKKFSIFLKKEFEFYFIK